MPAGIILMKPLQSEDVRFSVGSVEGVGIGVRAGSHQNMVQERSISHTVDKCTCLARQVFVNGTPKALCKCNSFAGTKSFDTMWLGVMRFAEIVLALLFIHFPLSFAAYSTECCKSCPPQECACSSVYGYFCFIFYTIFKECGVQTLP